MTKEIILTGITTTGTPHLGNYVGAIKPAIAASKNANVTPFYFLADYHALIKCQEPDRVRRSSLEIAATWLALGLDTSNAVFYRQSDVPEIMELMWMLTCVASKGLMNRAHAYKAASAENEQSGESDLDKGINMGLFASHSKETLLNFRTTSSPCIIDIIAYFLPNIQHYQQQKNTTI